MRAGQGILRFGQEQNVAGDSRLGGLEGQVGQAAPVALHSLIREAALSAVIFQGIV